jgi:hypothetical protein
MRPWTALTCLELLAAIAISAAPAFTVESPELPEGFSATGAGFYDNAGQFCISALPGDKKFRWDGSELHETPFSKVNSHGDSFYTYIYASENVEFPLRATVAHVNGVDQRLELADAKAIAGTSMNERSELVGLFQTSTGQYPFLWKNGHTYNLIDLIDPDSSDPVDITHFYIAQFIDDNSVIYGACDLRNGAIQLLKLIPNDTGRYSIHDLGTFPTGDLHFSQNGSITWGRSFWSNGVTTDIGDLGYPDKIWPHSVNSSGQIVGLCYVPGDQSVHGFFWHGAISDLNKLAELPDGWTINEAAEINDYGQIACLAYTGAHHAALFLTPLPKLIIRPAEPNHLQVQFTPGSPKPIQPQISTDLKSWTDLPRIEKPHPLETLDLPRTPRPNFLRLLR